MQIVKHLWHPPPLLCLYTFRITNDDDQANQLKKNNCRAIFWYAGLERKDQFYWFRYHRLAEV